MSKPLCVVSCPIDTYSGYGARSRDFVKALIELDKYDVKIMPQRWGSTRWGYLQKGTPEGDMFINRFIFQLTERPKLWIQITVPNEFQPVGEYNIGVTAGIETTVAHGSWIQGCNRMNLVLVSSNHSKNVFENTAFKIQDRQGNVSGDMKLKKPVEVLFEGIDVQTYKPIKDVKASTFNLDMVEESKAFLYVGHWLQGEDDHDRKGVGMLVKSFIDHYQGRKNRPALILKTQIGSSSIMDKDSVNKRINAMMERYDNPPSVYIVHGELTEDELNKLYNHKKVIAMVSLTKGEGFGRPLLEFALTGKPIICSAWSGHTDFLDPEYQLFIGGTLKNVHSSAVVKDVILPESQWFYPSIDSFKTAMDALMTKATYKGWLQKSKEYQKELRKNYSFGAMKTLMGKIIDKHVPDFPDEVELNLPTLKTEKPQITEL